MKNSAVLLIHCPDKPGIVVAITDFIHKNDGNILYLDQHVDTERGVFFMRIEWDLSKFVIQREKIAEYFDTLVGSRYQMTSQLHFSDTKLRMALFVSKLPHCFYDLLARYECGELNVEIPVIISNHDDLKHVADRLGIDFHCIEISGENKQQQEEKQKELLVKHGIDFIVLARYMQVLSDGFVKAYPQRIINIHHSFLPAFPGGRPYHSAFERGVKIIGATSHYVTAELDAGPIIEQDVVHVSHKDTVDDMVRIGRDLEKIVLARAVRHHVHNDLLVYENRTVVFE
ncbi:MAG: formyltetrahydrofolate deformylase [Gammaproteobacteria bacterium]|nr:formyltetrahydrofolate deformylase [Gammaproteobacteria bacterium]MBT8133230.1 formyltetrahydrofolate deformylase [Gammaproteobacteria bacterium]NNJ49328.1 formyltetrahydrofolate deformylase [Gammaproteobacteria bacterium]